MRAAFEPAVFKTKDAHTYVGGRCVWEDLMKHYGEGARPKLVPFRRTPGQGNEYWHRVVIDDVLLLAQMEGKLLSPQVK